MMVDVRGAIGAVVAIDGLAAVAVVGVGFWGAFGDGKVVFVGHLI